MYKKEEYIEPRFKSNGIPLQFFPEIWLHIKDGNLNMEQRDFYFYLLEVNV